MGYSTFRKEGVPETALSGLEQDYDRIDSIEEARSAAVARDLGSSDHRTFIPSVIAEYDFWKQFVSQVAVKNPFKMTNVL